MKLPTLDTIRALLRKPTPSVADLAQIVDNAAAVAAAADERSRVATAALNDNPLANSVDRAKYRDAAAAAHLEAEDAAAILAEAQRRHAAALADAEHARRSAVHEDGRKASDAAVKMIAQEYPAAVEHILSILKRLAEAQRIVAAANADLPADAAQLLDPEMIARGIPGTPREVVADEQIEAWGRFDLDQPVDAAFQSQIYDCGNGWGKRGHYEGGSHTQGESEPLYRKRRFHKLTTLEGVQASFPLPLAATVRLPNVRGNLMAWGSDHLPHDPGLYAAMAGEAEPAAVLARLADISARKDGPAPKPRRREKVEWVSHEDVVPLPAPQVRTDTTRTQPIAPARKFGASPFTPGRVAGGHR